MKKAIAVGLGIGAVVAAATTVLATSAAAQEWPRRKIIEIIIPSAAGSGPDATIRSYSEHLAKNLGQGIVITNRAGGSGTIAASAAARSDPDGYTFLLASPSQLVVNKYTIKNLSYDPDKDFQPVALVGRAPYIVLTNPDMPFRTLPELIAYNAKNPGKVFVAYEGASAKAASIYLLRALGINLTMVPYVNPNQAVQDLLAGNTQLHLQGTALALPFVKDGRLPALAVTGGERFPPIPDVPAVGETFPRFGAFETWVMLLAPRGTPQPIIHRMSKEIEQIAQLPDMRKLFDNLGIIGADADASPEAAVAFLQRQNEQFAKMAEIADLKPE
jgi:tripartite-type tricarboxylate transporter receptor subunit TctC